MPDNFWSQFLPAVAAGAAFLTMVVVQVNRYSPPEDRKRAIRATLAFMGPTFVIGLALIAWLLISFG
ncbi:hypothetical protein KKB64_04950 [Patescibacteria group bacterium]|nr:hypothetical protein [Patescibacteria group bacterium]